MAMLNVMRMALTARVKAFLKEEKGAVDIVAIVVMIGIAVVLALVFRNAIKDLLDSLLQTISGNAKQAIAN